MLVNNLVKCQSFLSSVAILGWDLACIYLEVFLSCAADHSDQMSLWGFSEKGRVPAPAEGVDLSAWGIMVVIVMMVMMINPGPAEVGDRKKHNGSLILRPLVLMFHPVFRRQLNSQKLFFFCNICFQTDFVIELGN